MWTRLRQPGMLELGGIVVLAVAYNVIRAAQGTDVDAALDHAAAIVRFEGSIFQWVEIPLNQWMATAAVFAVPACYFYAIAHYVATPTVLLLSRRRGGWAYRRGYLTLILASALALFVYATYPVAPPRLLHGSEIVDVMRAFADYGWWGNAASAPRGIGDATNQYAAMPSLHVGWSLWCAMQMWQFRGRWWKPVAIAYPTVQIIVVLGTGNHYLLDVVAGISVVLVAHLAVKALESALGRSHLTAFESPAG